MQGVCQEGETKRKRLAIPMFLGKGEFVITETRLLRRVCYIQLVLYLGRCNLSIVLIKRQHHGEAVP